MPMDSPGILKGRGTAANPDSRFAALTTDPYDDGWPADVDAPAPTTQVDEETARRIITRNRSPDVPFDQSVNPYQGCEHGCSYCFARPTHAYYHLSPGLDFETRLFAKSNGPELLVRELSAPHYRCRVIALGANTDPYQPVERHRQITRRLLEVFARFRQPVAIVTKSALVERDMDILQSMAEQDLVQVYVSVTTQDSRLARRMEPRAAAPQRRLQCISRLRSAGIPVGVMVAPVIPGLTDHEVESILAAAAQAGANCAGYVLLRLPGEVEELFVQWLNTHEPLRARRVLSLLSQMRDGQLNDGQFGSRMRGTGAYAQLLGQRFRLASSRLGLDKQGVRLATDLFQVPGKPQQLDLF